MRAHYSDVRKWFKSKEGADSFAKHMLPHFDSKPNGQGYLVYGVLDTSKELPALVGANVSVSQFSLSPVIKYALTRCC